MEANSKKWASYERVSTKEQDIENRQTPKIEEYINRYLPEINTKDVLKFQDQKSAYRYSKDKRKDFNKLLGMVRAGDIEGIIISDVDRISRKIEEHSELRKLFEEEKVKVLIASKNSEYKVASPENLIAQIIEDGLSKFESDNISVRTKAALETKRIKKLYAGGQLPYGYYWERGSEGKPGKALVSKNVREAIEKAYDLFEVIPNYAFVADYLNKNYPKDKAIVKGEGRDIKWTATHVKNLLLNPWYFGYQLPIEENSESSEEEILSKREIIPYLSDPPIISEKQWLRVWQMVHKEKHSLKVRIKTSFEFQGLIKCVCNEQLIGRDKTTKNPNGTEKDRHGVRYYSRKECNHRVREEDVIKRYKEEINLEKINEKVKEVLIYRIKREIETLSKRKMFLHEELTILESKLEMLQQNEVTPNELEDLYLPEHRVYAAYVVVKNALEKQHETTKQQCNYTVHMINQWTELEANYELQQEWINNAIENLQKVDYMRITALFLVKEIKLNENQEIDFHFYRP